MRVKISNKEKFLKNFLTPLSNLNEGCIFNIQNNNLYSIFATLDGTVTCKGDVKIETDFDDNIKLNIPDIKKLIRGLQLIDSNNFTLTINDNNLKFDSEDYNFTYYLLEDGILKEPKLNFNKIKDIQFNCSFIVKNEDIKNLIKGSSFATFSNKLYFFSEDSKIKGELGDRSKHNIDNFIVKLSDNYNGSSLINPVCVNFDTFRLINFSNYDDIEFKINNDIGIVYSKLHIDNISLTYVISALIN